MRVMLQRCRPLIVAAAPPAAVLLAASLLAAGCGSGAKEKDAPAPGAKTAGGESAETVAGVGTVRMVASPAAPSSGSPNLAVGSDGVLYLTWIEVAENGYALKMSRWEDGAWSTPVPVAEGGDWFVNWADVPSLTALADGTLFAHWLAVSGDDTYAYDVRIAVSRDGGASWSKPVTPHRDGTKTQHGFVSLVPLADGVGVVWLDGRETSGHAHDEGEGAGPPMTLRYAVVDRDGTLHDEALLDPRVCDCCPTGAVRLDDGTLVVVYRDRSEEEVRDISVLRKDAAGWSGPSPVHRDDWKITACPVNGPAVDARGKTVVAAWFTADAEDMGHVRAAFSGDGGATFGPPVAVDDGHPLGRVDCALMADGSALVSWLEDGGSPGLALIRLRRVTEAGTGPAVVVAPTSPSPGSGVPVMARLGSDVFLAWTNLDARQVMTARCR